MDPLDPGATLAMVWTNLIAALPKAAKFDQSGSLWWTIWLPTSWAQSGGPNASHLVGAVLAINSGWHFSKNDLDLYAIKYYSFKYHTKDQTRFLNDRRYAWFNWVCLGSTKFNVFYWI